MTNLTVQTALDFSRAAKLTQDEVQSSYVQLNTVVFYDNVYVDPITGQKVDSIVTFYRSKNAYVNQFDSSTSPFNNPNYIQPSVNFYGDNYPSYNSNTVEAYISYNIQFIEDNSLATQGPLNRNKVSVTNTKELLYDGSTFYKNVTLNNLALNAYNVDGYTQYQYNIYGQVTNSYTTSSRNFVETNQSDVKNIKTYPTPSTSELSVSNPNSESVRVQSITGGYQTSPPGTLNFDRHRTTLVMNDVDSLNITMGDAYIRETNLASFSLNFGANLDPITRFFVPDSSVNKMFEYGSFGTYKGNWNIVSSSRDVAASPDSSKLWVIDKNKQINVYDDKGVFKGSWKTSIIGKNPEGVAYDNFNGTNSIWVADDQGKIQWYFNSGNYLSGTYGANTTFTINVGTGNKLKGIATDSENNLWVVIDGSDQIRRYSINRYGNNPTGITLTGTWKLPEMGTPTGITLAPNQSASNGDIWVVVDGSQTDRVLTFSGMRGLVTGSPIAPYTETYLTSSNINPQGIANPYYIQPVGSNSSPYGLNGPVPAVTP
jgi:hypothetical protein